MNGAYTAGPAPESPATPASPRKERPGAAPRAGGSPCLKLMFAGLCAALVLLPFGLLYGRELRAGGGRATLASYMPSGAAQAAAGGYISLSLQLTQVDLEQGRSELLVTNIRPYGRFARARGSMFLANATYLFINGNRVLLPADLPPSERHVFVHHDSSGTVNSYPFDKHAVRLSFYAMTQSQLSSTVQSALNNATMRTSPFVPVAWKVAARSPLSIAATRDSASPLAEIGVSDINVTISRRPASKWFAFGVVGVMWAISLGVLAQSYVSIVNRMEIPPNQFILNAAMLYVLPALRSSMPQVPMHGTFADTMGFYWNVSLVALSFAALVLFSLLKHRNEERQRRARQARAIIEAQVVAASRGKAAQELANPALPQLPPIPRHVGSPMSAIPTVAAPFQGFAGLSVDPRSVPLPPSHIAGEDHAVPMATAVAGRMRAPALGVGAAYVRTSARMLGEEDEEGLVNVAMDATERVTNGPTARNAAGLVPGSANGGSAGTPVPTPVVDTFGVQQ